jgi:hypothetical protein
VCSLASLNPLLRASTPHPDHELQRCSSVSCRMRTAPSPRMPSLLSARPCATQPPDVRANHASRARSKKALPGFPVLSLLPSHAPFLSLTSTLSASGRAAALSRARGRKGPVGAPATACRAGKQTPVLFLSLVSHTYTHTYTHTLSLSLSVTHTHILTPTRAA